MAKTDFERRRDLIGSWVDWVFAAAGCIAWAFAITSFVVLLISMNG